MLKASTRKNSLAFSPDESIVAHKKLKAKKVHESVTVIIYLRQVIRLERTQKILNQRLHGNYEKKLKVICFEK